MKNFKKYSLYAIGEIILIVVGVLIAIAVNNYNSVSAKEKKLVSVIQKVKLNLENDINNLDVLISDYESLDTVINDVITGRYPIKTIDTINELTIDDCASCYAYHIGFSPFYSKLDGFEQLKSINLDWNSGKNEMTQDVLFFYQEQLRDIKLLEQTITAEILSNLKSIEQFDWYIDYMLNEFNPESVRYFHTDKMYKNKLTTYKTLVIDNYLRMLNEYRSEAKALAQSLTIG